MTRPQRDRRPRRRVLIPTAPVLPPARAGATRAPVSGRLPRSGRRCWRRLPATSRTRCRAEVRYDSNPGRLGLGGGGGLRNGRTGPFVAVAVEDVREVIGERETAGLRTAPREQRLRVLREVGSALEHPGDDRGGDRIDAGGAPSAVNGRQSVAASQRAASSSRGPHRAFERP
jgi:hypothetical protein